MNLNRLFAVGLTLLVGGAYLAVKKLAPRPGRLPYEAPRHMDKRTRFGLRQLAPRMHAQPPTAEEDPQMPAVQAPKAKKKPPSSPFHTIEAVPSPAAYLRVHVYKQQQVRAGSGITLQLEEAAYLGGQHFAAGALLHGLVRFGHDRVLIRIHTAQPRMGKPVPVQLVAYETDYNEGLYVPGASEWEKPKERLADVAVGHTAGTLRELGNLATYTWKCLKTKQSVLLSDGRVLFVGPTG